MFRPTPFQPDHDRFYYEPRVFWSTKMAQASSLPRRTFAFPQEHFRNISRFPIRLTKLLLSPVGYLTRSFEAPAAVDYGLCAAQLARAQVSIEYPRGYSGQRRPGPTMLYGMEPTGDPSLGDTPTPAASSLFGVSRWDFDVPYIVPADYQIPLELSNVRSYNLGVALPQTFRMNRAFFERTRSWILGHVVGIPGSLGAAQTGLAYPAGPQPTDAPDAAIFPVQSSNQPGPWSPGGSFPGGEWGRQKSNKGLPFTEVTGFAVHIDQREFDDDAAAALAGAYYNNPRMAPMAQRVITRCRTVNAGTYERWWRDGAPLSLVTPTLNTSAFVRTLEDPIVLGPGEAINVSLTLPETFQIDQSTVDPLLSVGVSLAGYAVVEDNTVKFPPVPGQFFPQPMI